MNSKLTLKSKRTHISFSKCVMTENEIRGLSRVEAVCIGKFYSAEFSIKYFKITALGNTLTSRLKCRFICASFKNLRKFKRYRCNKWNLAVKWASNSFCTYSRLLAYYKLFLSLKRKKLLKECCSSDWRSCEKLQL